MRPDAERVTVPVEAEPEAETPGVGPGPILQVLALRAYRYYWVAQFLSALVNGTLRFVFIWLVLDLTDWAAAVGLMGVALGVPALILSAPAGVLSDRTDRRLLVVRAATATSLSLVVTAALVATDLMNLTGALIAAFAVSAIVAPVTPALMAIVPTLVSQERLLSGVALQNIGMMLAQVIGAVVAGGAIDLFGTGGAFVALAALKGGSAFFMWCVEMPRPSETPARDSALAEMREGLRFALLSEPIRSLLGVALLAGFSVGVVTILVPELARNRLGQDALSTSLLFAALASGLMITSIGLATRRTLERRGWLMAAALTAVAGPGLIAMAVAPDYPFLLGVMFCWGLGGGAVLTMQRTLLQETTPDEMMGRVMGLNWLMMSGAFPLSALAAIIGAPRLGTSGTLLATGLIALAASAAVWRRALRRL